MVKNKKSTLSLAPKVANFFGGLGYLSLLLQWTWVALLFVLPMIVSGNGFFIPNPGKTHQIATSQHSSYSPITIYLTIVVVLLILIFTVVAIIKLPKTVGKSGAKLTRQTAELVLPIVHKQYLPEPQKIKFSVKVIIFTKIILLTSPLLISVFIDSPESLGVSVVLSSSAVFTVLSLVNFCLQYSIGYLYKIPKQRLW